MFFSVDINPVALQIGPLAIHWYALMYLFGIGIALWTANALKKHLCLSYNDCLDWINYAVIGLLVGGRLGYVLFYNLGYYLDNPLHILFVWKGGMAFHGGAIGACVGTYLFARAKKISLFKTFDVLVLSACPGLFLGRIGNFINGELVGRATEANWGFIFKNHDAIPRHPSQLYEAFGEGILLSCILWLAFSFFRLKPGNTFALFISGYGSFRFLIEFFREPDSQIGFLYAGLSLGQYLCLATILIGLLTFLYVKRCHD